MKNIKIVGKSQIVLLRIGASTIKKKGEMKTSYIALTITNLVLLLIRVTKIDGK